MSGDKKMPNIIPGLAADSRGLLKEYRRKWPIF